MTMKLPLVQAHRGPALPLPAYQTEGSAGLDLTADAFERGDGALSERFVLAPGQRVLARTGLRLGIPDGHVGYVCPRSGLALKHGITLLNSPGVIDCDFRGELAVILVNLGHEPFTCERGMRVAQLVIAPYARAQVVLAEGLDETQRGNGGFGSTGV